MSKVLWTKKMFGSFELKSHNVLKTDVFLILENWTHSKQFYFAEVPLLFSLYARMDDIPDHLAFFGRSNTAALSMKWINCLVRFDLVCVQKEIPITKWNRDL